MKELWAGKLMLNFDANPIDMRGVSSDNLHQKSLEERIR